MKYIESVKFHGELPEKSYLNDIPAVQWLAERGEL